MNRIVMTAGEYAEFDELRFPGFRETERLMGREQTEFSTEEVATILIDRGWLVRDTQLDAMVRRQVVFPEKGGRNYRWVAKDIEAAADHLDGIGCPLSLPARTCEHAGIRLIDWWRALYRASWEASAKHKQPVPPNPGLYSWQIVPGKSVTFTFRPEALKGGAA